MLLYPRSITDLFFKENSHVHSMDARASGSRTIEIFLGANNSLTLCRMLRCSLLTVLELFVIAVRINNCNLYIYIKFEIRTSRLPHGPSWLKLRSQTHGHGQNVKHTLTLAR